MKKNNLKQTEKRKYGWKNRQKENSTNKEKVNKDLTDEWKRQKLCKSNSNKVSISLTQGLMLGEVEDSRHDH